ncbi:FAD-dependent oxidoreductase [Phycicoccus sp. CSK15P-2]|uniref:NAD(P)/FAD-dependent oxidoreductase n=1 Tax=Phycicoccus sp. CSK15P-2 TaxID=2807627 RepID=UPI0019513B6A|nr:FAD-dependent oxidoreductase [Phycicoccus sp. CSK15P-2]MBM6403624.1 FAD-dependent oxidoreductase [Phycicoccus sp. CSK15P-2]MBM6405089.1 FAD-dependent oxidoreductase [Phycicoccus sp. CSK15P-2]
MTVSPAAVRAALTDAVPDVYWMDRPALRPVARPALTGSGLRTDLVVVGGGFTGLWAAVQAKEDDPSRDVVLLEAGRFGIAASGRNGGFVSPSLTHGLAQGVACWPDEIGRLERLGAENMAAFIATLERHGVDADLHVPGELTTALTEHQVTTVRELHDLHREHGVPVALLDAEATRALVDSPRYLAGMLDPTVGLVDPARLVWGLADVAERLGVRLHEDTAVTGLDVDGSGVRVSTEWGAVTGRRVVLGTGAFPGPLRRLRYWTVPVYDHVLMSEPLSATQLAEVGWEGREGITDAGNQFHYYRRTLDDRVLFGGYDASYHFPGRIDPRYEQSPSHDLLARHFLEIFPQLEGIRFTHRWAGVIDTTTRFTPVFGTALGGRVSYAVGYTGLGVASTRFGARVALDLVDGRDTEATRLSMVRRKPLPFPPEPVRGAGIRLTRAALAAEDRTGRRGPWLRALDRLGVGFDS